jgi:hypothetical protein
MDESGQTIEEILKVEAEAFEKAHEKYGAFFENAMDFTDLLNSFLQEVNPDAVIFVMFLAQVKKFNLLALLSVVRLHHVQAMLDMRQVLEAGANAAYGLANPSVEDFIVTREDGVADAPKKLTTKRYAWLEQNYPAGSNTIKNQKELINSSSAHSTMIYVFNNFDMQSEGTFGMSYFDKDDEYMTKTNLWFVGNTALGLMDLFFGVNKDHNRIKFIPDFKARLLALQKQNHALKAEMSKHPRFMAAQVRSET